MTLVHVPNRPKARIVPVPIGTPAPLTIGVSTEGAVSGTRLR